MFLPEACRRSGRCSEDQLLVPNPNCHCSHSYNRDTEEGVKSVCVCVCAYTIYQVKKCVCVCVPPVDQRVYQVCVSLCSSQVEQCHPAVTHGVMEPLSSSSSSPSSSFHHALAHSHNPPLEPLRGLTHTHTERGGEKKAFTLK